VHQAEISVVRSLINEVNIRSIAGQSKNIVGAIHCSFLDNVSNNVHEVQVRVHKKDLQKHILHCLPNGQRLHAQHASQAFCRNQVKSILK
jgi:hypothetical protein